MVGIQIQDISLGLLSLRHHGEQTGKAKYKYILFQTTHEFPDLDISLDTKSSRCFLTYASNEPFLHQTFTKNLTESGICVADNLPKENTMTKRTKIGGLSVASPLFDTISTALSGTGIDKNTFWSGLESVFSDFAPRNKKLLEKRDDIQSKLDIWYKQNPERPYDPETYHTFLREIGYLVPEGDDFTITTSNVDPEIATIAGPQLVVPVTIARFALNAANARWGSLYDALYGADVLADDDDAKKTAGYVPARGRLVMNYVSGFLDKALPLEKGLHKDVVSFQLEGDKEKFLTATLKDGSSTQLTTPEKFVGYTEEAELKSLIFKNNGLHIELQFDSSHPVGKDHPAGIKDVVMESALTTILDCEDSVAVVDGEDKALVYANLLGLMKGSLETSFEKAGQTVTRSMNSDRKCLSPTGASFSLSGRSLMLVRTVGHLMTTDAVVDANGREIPEGILDTMVTALVALHDLNGDTLRKNSPAGSVYIVKPKMHGPEEVAFTCDLFASVETALGMKPGTLKIGIMDEERRTTLNLKECIRVAKDRIIFINTGFLDRTGDEIHTSMEAGPMLSKDAIKGEPWIAAYEDWNVDVGLACGFSGRAQIGKGMWAKPDELGEMVDTKIAHPEAGANCAWVPSPTAATLHAMHYHMVDVFERQKALAGKQRATLATLTTLPLMGSDRPTSEEVTRELANNAQSILGDRKSVV